MNLESARSSACLSPYLAACLSACAGFLESRASAHGFWDNRHGMPIVFCRYDLQARSALPAFLHAGICNNHSFYGGQKWVPELGAQNVEHGGP